MYTSSTIRPEPRRKKRTLAQLAGRVYLRLRAAAWPVTLAACVFLFSFVEWFHIPSPFGAAMLLAFSARPTGIMLLGAGASLGLRFLWGLNPDVWQYVGLALLWLLRQKCRPRAGIETAALGGLAMLPRIIAALLKGSALEILLSCAALPMAMLFSAALRHGTDAASQSGAAARIQERFCMMLIALLAVSGLGYFRVGPVNLGQTAAAVLTVLFAMLSGPVYGVSGGMLCGLVLAMGGHDSRIALSLAVGGFLCGLPSVTRRRWLTAPGVLAGNALAFFVMPLSQPPLTWWAAAAGGLLALAVPVAALERIKPYLRGMEAGDRSMENAFVNQRIAHMRDAIERLARALPQCESGLSSGEALGERLCARCDQRPKCWGKSRSRTERMLASIMEGESVSETDCVRADSIPQTTREVKLTQQKRSAATKKARYERELTLTHLAALSGTLGDLAAMAAGESFNDLRAAHVITLALEELHVPARLSYARRVEGHLLAALEWEGINPSSKTLDTLLQHLAQEEEMQLGVSRSEKGRVELEEIPLYSASVGMATISADGAPDGVCGDACSVKRCEGGRLLMMLCDGMGHGEAAHRQSEKTLELLLLLLEAGYTRRQAITAVNGIMLGAQQEERFSTVDLADVDLWTGDVWSEKLGACASWVVRGSHVKKLEGSSLPLGIVQEASPAASQYRLHSGDILILMSDGVADVFEDDLQFRKVLEESLYIQPQRMADALLRGALLAGGGTPRDDMSVMVLLLMDSRHG